MKKIDSPSIRAPKMHPKISFFFPAISLNCAEKPAHTFKTPYGSPSRRAVAQAYMLSDDEWYSSEAEPHDASGAGGGDVVHDPEEWMDYNAEFLLTLWHQLQDQVAAMGVYILDACTIGDFTEFCHRFSSGRKPPC